MGVELGEFFRGERRWSQFHRLLRGLPWHSLYRRAVQDDPDVAEAYAKRVTDVSVFDAPESPSLREWDEFRELAADIADAVSLSTIQQINAQIPKGKPSLKFKPAKRPVPAMQLALRERERELESALEDSFLSDLGG